MTYVIMDTFLVLSIAPIYALALFSSCSIPFSCRFKHLSYMHMEDYTLCEASHLDLPHYLGLNPTSRWVRLIPIVDFPSGSRPCCPRLLFPVFQPNHRLCLVQRLVHHDQHHGLLSSNPHSLTPMRLMSMSNQE